MVHDPSGSREHGNREPPAEWPRRKSLDEHEGDFKGLCVNCANRHTCLLPKAEGGVWHCEEYLEEH
jgi:hypothetical protein